MRIESFQPSVQRNATDAVQSQPKKALKKQPKASSLARTHRLKSHVKIGAAGLRTSKVTNGGVRVEQKALLQTLDKSLSRLDPVEKALSLTLHRQIAPLVSRILTGTNSVHKPASTYGSLGEAIEAANTNNAGRELIVAREEDGQKFYEVIKLKKTASPEELMQSLDSVEAYATNKNGVLKPVAPSHELNENLAQRYQRVESLAKVAVQDESRGFDLARAGDQRKDRTPAYRANLTLAHTQINDALKALHQRASVLDSGPQTKNALAELAKIKPQLAYLRTADTLIMARLLQMPKSDKVIPQTDLKYGQYRLKSEPVHKLLQTRIQHLEMQKSLNTSPEAQAALSEQQRLLKAEGIKVSHRSYTIDMAGLDQTQRLFHLASMNQSLDSAQSDLNKHLRYFKEIDKTTHKGLRNYQREQISTSLKVYQEEIGNTKKLLIKDLENHLKSYRGLVNLKKRGGRDAVALIEMQIKRLKAVSLEGEPDAKSVENLLGVVTETRQLLLQSVQSAAKDYVGISPAEGRALTQLAQNTGKYIKGCQQAKKDVVTLKQTMQEVNRLYETPALHENLMPYDELSKLDEVYLAKIQDVIKNDQGPPFPRMRALYTALEMSKNKKVPMHLRHSIKVQDIRRELNKIGENGRLQRIFKEKKAEALAEVFPQGKTAKAMKERLLSNDFADYLDYQLPRQRKLLLNSELNKLAILDPQAAQDVKEALQMEHLQNHAFAHLQKIPSAQRTELLKKLLAHEGIELSKAKFSAKTAKIAQNLSVVIDQLGPGEINKLQDAMKLMGRDKLKGSLKVAAILENRMGKLGADSDLMLLLKDPKMAGKLGGIVAVSSLLIAYQRLGHEHQNAKDYVKSVGAGAAAGSKLDTLAKLARFDAAQHFQDLDMMIKELPKGVITQADKRAWKRAAFMADAAKYLDFLGPVADLTGVYLDTQGAVDDYTAGNYGSAVAKTTSAAAGAASAYVSVGILVGSSGPAAPLVLAGLTTLGLVAWGAGAILGESEQEAFLRNNGFIQ